MAAPDERVTRVPVSIVLDECLRVILQARLDIDALQVTGLEASTVSALEVAFEKLRLSTARWNVSKAEKNLLKATLPALRKAALANRSDLARYFRLIFGNSGIVKVPGMSHDRRGSKLLADIDMLALLGRNNLELLKKRGFDEKLISQAEKAGRAYCDALIAATYISDNDLDMRRAFYSDIKVVWGLLTEIRKAAMIAFDMDQQKAAMYRSSYIHNLNSKRNGKVQN